jgi:hypothetical protein
MTATFQARLLFLAGLFSAFVPPAWAYQLLDESGWTADATLNTRMGLRQGFGINFGAGALYDFGTFDRSTGETERTDLQLALRPGLRTDYRHEDFHAYGGIIVAAATTTLDGELSGQFSRAGDEVIDFDSAYLGVEYGVFDLSYGPQPFTVGDGFILGDGTFNQGHDNGQYWTGAFEAWRNTGILKINTAPIRADVFWLKADADLSRSSLAGFNLENSDKEAWGRVGVMAFEIFDDKYLGWEGMRVWGLRGADLHLPDWTGLRFYAEYVHQGGQSDRSGVDNDADAWYVEPAYQFQAWPWRPRFHYRYARYSGDEANTPENEEYRGLFFTLGKRDWDTWYQGEVNGEFFMFNQNQITHMFKVKAYPDPRYSVMAMYYHHQLDEPRYFGVSTPGTAWSDEVNVELEFHPDDRLYGLVGVAWATPHRAARSVFGDDSQLVLELFVSYTFR